MKKFVLFGQGRSKVQSIEPSVLHSFSNPTLAEALLAAYDRFKESMGKEFIYLLRPLGDKRIVPGM